jgi:hypothetical protein
MTLYFLVKFLNMLGTIMILGSGSKDDILAGRRHHPL